MRTVQHFIALPLFLFACTAPAERPEPVAPVPSEAVADKDLDEDSGFLVAVVYQTIPGQADAFLAAADELLAEVRKEPHFLRITVLRDVDNPESIVFLERWADKEYYAEPHQGTPHLNTFRGAVIPLLVAPPNVVYWNVHADLRADQ